MKARYLWVGIAVIIISSLSNYTYFQSKQLKEPIFLTHYYQRPFESGGTQLQFHYLTNKRDPLTVRYAVINGAEVYPDPDANAGGMFGIEEQNWFPYEQEFDYQYLASVALNLNEDLLPKNGPLSFNKMDVVFSDGTKVKTDIGKVSLVKDKDAGYRNAFEQQMASSGSDHLRTDTAQAMMPLEMNGIAIPFADEIGKDITIKFDADQARLGNLNDVSPDAWTEDGIVDEASLASISDMPLSLDKGDWISIRTRFNPDHKGYYDFEVDISGTLKDGGNFTYPVLLNDQPELNQTDVEQIIAGQKGRGSK